MFNANYFLPLFQIFFKDFVSKHPNLKVSLSTFKRYRPKHVKIMRFNKLIQCLCERCENVKLEVKALNCAGADMGTLTEELESAMCPKTYGWWMPKCVKGTCIHCGVHHMKPVLVAQCASSPSVKVWKWKPFSSCRITEPVSMIMSDAIDGFLESVIDLRLHYFTVTKKPV